MFIRIAAFFGLITLLSLHAERALGFPEMMRKGYQSCVSCHISPAGGGVLTDYGREISKDVLATWSREGEQNVLHGAVTLPDFLKLGGDLRSLHTYTKTPSSKTNRWFVMQANVEAAVIIKQLTAVASLDYDIQNPQVKGDEKYESFRHYLMMQVNDYVSIRAGKFQKNFGLGIADHTTQIRRGIGFNEGSETYNAEFNYIAEAFSLNATYVGGRPDAKDITSDKAVVLGGSYYLNGANRIGGSFYQGKTSDEIEKRVFGPNWSLSYDKTWYWLGELDILQLKPKTGASSSGVVSFNKIGFEIFRGADLYAMHELKKTEFDAKDIDFIAYGPGFQWSPRPHFILTGQWQKQLRPSAEKPRTIDSAYFIAQYAI